MSLSRLVLQAPRPSEGFLAIGRDLVPAVETLAAGPNVMALSILAGHATECLLKAMLSHAGMTETALAKPSFGHNLDALWRAASAKTGRVPEQIPDWVKHLNQVWAPPFPLRYPTKWHGLALPVMIDMRAGLRDLLVIAETDIRQRALRR
jgi:hypothetical protein